MPEANQGFSLELFGKYGKTSARKEASTKDTELDRKRVEFQESGKTLRAIIGRMQDINRLMADATPEERVKLDHELNQLYTISSLQGMVGMYDGLGLNADMNSIALSQTHKKTGEKRYFRRSSAEMLNDMEYTLLDLACMMEDLTRMTYIKLMKEGVIWPKFDREWDADYGVETRRRKQERTEDNESVEETVLSEPAPVGVPPKMTAEQSQEVIKGKQEC